MPSDEFDSNLLMSVIASFNNAVQLVSIAPQKQENWNILWESNYEPVTVAGKCLVRAPFHPQMPGFAYEITILPKMAFGTAHHATTKLMIGLLLQSQPTGKKVLDIGCGTGVLAILASMMGATIVTAIDNDEWAVKNAIENNELNGTNVEVLAGDASAIPATDYDLIMANINRNVLLEDFGNYISHLNRSGKIFLSGFYEEDIVVIKDEAARYGFMCESKHSLDDWFAIVFVKDKQQ
ncbi:MAG TPA: 50S ribosomal protein L11 methyltransferase [Bacteroidales bacterium]|nr:50S ribosomal protein L11 methyltransferase [Bacteroidales bacterium]